MRKSRYLKLKPLKTYGKIRTNYNCSIYMTPDEYSVGIFDKEAGGFCSDEGKTFKSYIEAAKYVIENDLIVSHTELYEGDEIAPFNIFYIACFKKGDECYDYR